MNRPVRESSASFVLVFAANLALGHALPKGELLYKQRCADCHETGAPPGYIRRQSG